MLKHLGLFDGFWDKALVIVVHITKMSPNRALHFKILQELWTNKHPECDKIRIFGCEVFPIEPKDERRKFTSHSQK